jgi:MoxR-like ATPase
MDVIILKKIANTLRQRVFGNEELISALLSAYYRRLCGVPTHLLTYGPTGVGKTVTSKNFARIASELNGGNVVFGRIQGRPDLMPEEIIADRVVEYDDAGRPGFGYQLGSIKMLRAENNPLPAILQVDEIDKITPRSMHAFLEVMEEQQATLANGETVALNFVMVATANTRKYDPTANPIPRSTQDRFRAGVVHLGYGSAEQDRKMLDWHLNSWAMRVDSADSLLSGIVTCVKMTQQKVDGYSDFTRYIKVPAGPRAILDLYSEAATRCIFEGRSNITPDDCIATGVRIMRGRVEVTPDAEINGKTTDVVLTEILHEVFGGMKIPSGSGNGSGKNSQKAQAEQSESESGEQGQQTEASADDTADEKAADAGEKTSSDSEGVEEGKEEVKAENKDNGSSERNSVDASSEADKQNFMAGLRKEMSKESGRPQ